jgi:hypothetical protein
MPWARDGYLMASSVFNHTCAARARDPALTYCKARRLKMAASLHARWRTRSGPFLAPLPPYQAAAWHVRELGYIDRRQVICPWRTPLSVASAVHTHAQFTATAADTLAGGARY